MTYATCSPDAEHNYYQATITLSWIRDDGYSPPEEIKRVSQYKYRKGKDSRKAKWFYRGTVVTWDGGEPSNDFERGEQEAVDNFFNR